MMTSETVAMSYGVARSPEWADRATLHRYKQPNCLVCGRRTYPYTMLQVHHKFPFHYIMVLGRPDLELDERNLFTMCAGHDEEHHLLIGHLGNFETYNPWLEDHIAKFRGLLASQIKSTYEYKRAENIRPKALKDMSQSEKDKMLETMNYLMPLAQ